MAFAQWKNQNTPIATATVATVATLELKNSFKSDINLPTVAEVATVAVVENENLKESEPISKTELLPQSPIFGGNDCVILANSENLTLVDSLPTVAKVATVAADDDDYLKLDKYVHCITCNQCENLSLTGSCTQLGKHVLHQALRECDSFKLQSNNLIKSVEIKPYSQNELERLLNQAAKPLYYHLIDCEQCSLEDGRYCAEGFTMGDNFDCLLLCFDEAANKRYLLMNQVIKARVSGRRAFIDIEKFNSPPP